MKKHNNWPLYRKIERVFWYLGHPRDFFANRKFHKLVTQDINLSDEEYIQKMFRIKTGYKLDLDNPKTINEKINWLKLFDRNPDHISKVDKYLVRDYVSKTIGDKYLVPLIGAWDSADEIDFDALPDRFVLKCNHSSGYGNFICHDKSKIDVSEIRDYFRNSINEDYYHYGREWPYKDVKRKIICEQLLETESSDLVDYKFWVFNGECKLIMLCANRTRSLRVNFYDTKLNQLRCKRGHFNFKIKNPFPTNLDEMVSIAEKLAGSDVFVRVDLYDVNGNIYFGELTYFPASGFERFCPQKYDYQFGELLDLGSLQQ